MICSIHNEVPTQVNFMTIVFLRIQLYNCIHKNTDRVIDNTKTWFWKIFFYYNKLLSRTIKR